MEAITDLAVMRDLELSIMKVIHSFCEENNICYYLAYGTLLGAIRHGGFIPWDDDIDIWMLRKDYDKFGKLFPEYGKSKGLYIATKYSNPCLPRNMYKVCDDRTILEETKYRVGDKIGVFVDVWPLDATPNNSVARKFHNFNMLLAHSILHCGIMKEEYFAGGIPRRICRVIYNVIGINRVLDAWERISKKYEISDKTISVESCAEVPRGFSYEDFKTRHLAKFEDSEFYIPDGYDRILTCRYGDYMTLPPKEKQTPHHVQDTYWK